MCKCYNGNNQNDNNVEINCCLKRMDHAEQIKEIHKHIDELETTYLFRRRTC